MMVDTRPTTCVTFKKKFDEPIDLKHLLCKYKVDRLNADREVI